MGSNHGEDHTSCWHLQTGDPSMLPAARRLEPVHTFLHPVHTWQCSAVEGQVMWGLLCRACMTTASDVVLYSQGKLAVKLRKFQSMQYNSATTRAGYPLLTKIQKINFSTTFSVTALTVATKPTQQAITARTRSLQQARHSWHICLHLKKQPGANIV